MIMNGNKKLEVGKMYYDDISFSEKTGQKPGVVRQLKKQLREQGLIGNRQRFSEKHIPLMERAVQIKQEESSTWEEAMNKAIKGTPSHPDSQLALVKDAIGVVIKAVKGLEEQWDKITDDSISDIVLEHYPLKFGTMEDITDTFEKWRATI